MPLAVSTKQVRCHACGRVFAVASAARSCTCMHCYKSLVLDDLMVDNSRWVSALATCGRILISPRTRVVTRSITASQGIEVHGDVQSKMVSRGVVAFGEDAVFRGQCQAARLIVRPGAIFERAFFDIRPERGGDQSAPDDAG